MVSLDFPVIWEKAAAFNTNVADKTIILFMNDKFEYANVEWCATITVMRYHAYTYWLWELTQNIV
jgi:hypothetical protein